MPKVHSARVSLIAVAVSLCLASCGQSPATPTIKLTAEDTYTYDCESVTQRPESIVIACADAGMYLEKIVWSKWTPKLAKGSGLYSHNDCDPNCAEGTMHSQKVLITLSDPTTYKKRNILRTLTFRSLDNQPFSQWIPSPYTWDLLEFAQMMDQDQ